MYLSDATGYCFFTGEGGDAEGEYDNGISFSSKPELEESTDAEIEKLPTNISSDALSKRSFSRISAY